MFDLVEQPWTLLTLSGLTFLVIGTLRTQLPSRYPNKLQKIPGWALAHEWH